MTTALGGELFTRRTCYNHRHKATLSVSFGHSRQLRPRLKSLWPRVGIGIGPLRCEKCWKIMPEFNNLSYAVGVKAKRTGKIILRRLLFFVLPSKVWNILQCRYGNFALKIWCSSIKKIFWCQVGAAWQLISGVTRQKDESAFINKRSKACLS